MYLMYFDESGDSGIVNSPTKYFILSAIVFHELRWRSILQSLVSFRRMLRDTKGLKIREEIHSSDFINKPGGLKRIKRNDRVDILKKCVDWVNEQSGMNVFSVAVNKQGKSNDIFELAWNGLFTRFENTIERKNFVGPQNADDRGVVISDNTEGEKLTKLLRKMRHYNPIPNRVDLFHGGYRDMKIQFIIEDPVLRDSQQSLVHQMCDVVAYCARQLYEPNNYMKRKGGNSFYTRLNNVSTKAVTTANNLEIVPL
jgi:hypothetical protein